MSQFRSPLDSEEDDSPYSSVSTRDPLQDVSPLGQMQASNQTDPSPVPELPPGRSPASSLPVPPPEINPVKNAILKRMAASGGKPGANLADDPLMKDYESKEKDLEDFRQAKMKSDSMTNLGQAFAQAAQGANTPVMDKSLYSNMDAQSAGILKSKEEDEDRRQRIINAIEQRNTRVGIADDNAKNRASAARAAAIAHGDAVAQREQDKQNSVTQQVITRLTGAKSSQDVQQAYKDRYASSKLNELFSQYGDLNKMSPNQVNLAISEVAKMASGGSPDDHTMKMLSPDSFRGQLASTYQKWTNSPSAANAGDFLKQYKDYADGLSRNADKLINDRIGKDLEASKGAIGDMNYKTLKAQYLPQDQVPKSSDPDMSKALPGQYSPDVIKYAKSHNIPPEQAQAIKDLRSGK